MSRRCWLVLALLPLAACARSSGTAELKAAFSDDTVVGALEASWQKDGEAREGNGPAHRLAFRVDATNRLSAPVYLRLREFRLLGPWGKVGAGGAIDCALAPGTTVGVMRGTVWLPAAQAGSVRGFEVDRFVLPLSERGRAFYREFLLRQRPGDAAEIDAEIGRYAAAPPCRPAS
jgi:hypothetical protein